jgi:hypothetical protein
MEHSRRELFLQQRLALCATLLYDASQIVRGKSPANIPTFLVECELFFSETKSLLAAELARGAAKAALPISAQPAARPGAVWTSPGWNGWQPASPAIYAAPLQDTEAAPAPSSSPSPGGTNPTENPSPLNFSMRIKLSFSTKPKGI